jgi:riboflavin kinase/FMN adenylyltransferase
MRIVRAGAGSPCAVRGAAVAIGNFDGLHRGHRAVVAAAAAFARELGAPLGVVTFEPHPREVIQPEAAPARLTPLRRKAELLAELGVDLLYPFRFDGRLMRQAPEDFVGDALADRLGVRAVAAGEDFRFGHRRAGDVGLLTTLGAARGIRVAAVPPVEVEGSVCSSTRVRAAVADGEMALTERLLGYAYAVDGIVRPGDRRGRTIGFPTANVHPVGRRPLLPATGVYAVRAGLREPGGGGMAWYPAVANLGRRPTFDGQGLLLEVHLLEGGGDLYGRRLRVAFLERLRGEQKFGGIEELKAQIARDAERACAVHVDRHHIIQA